MIFVPQDKRTDKPQNLGKSKIAPGAQVRAAAKWHVRGPPLLLRVLFRFFHEPLQVEVERVGTPYVGHLVRHLGGPHNVGALLEQVLPTLRVSNSLYKNY